MTSCSAEWGTMTPKIFQLGHLVTDAVAERAHVAVINVDPEARLQVQRRHRQLLVDTTAQADAVAESLLRAGLRVQAWSAELPLRDGFARVSLRSGLTSSR